MANLNIVLVEFNFLIKNNFIFVSKYKKNDIKNPVSIFIFRLNRNYVGFLDITQPGIELAG